MTKIMVNWIFKTVVGRWVTLGVVTMLLGGGALMWRNFKQGLIEEGTQVCVQEINKETMLQLEDALAAEKSARAALTANLIAAAAVNKEANDRRRASQDRVNDLEKAMAEQRKTDETYREWSDSSLPDGVAIRLRNTQAGSD